MGANEMKQELVDTILSINNPKMILFIYNFINSFVKKYSIMK